MYGERGKPTERRWTEMTEQREDPKDRSRTIVINGRRVETDLKEVSFEQVVALSGLPTGPEVIFTVSYRRGQGDKPEGTLVQGGAPAKVKEGMIFNVDPTNRS
jgi:hypothetical protein